MERNFDLLLIDLLRRWHRWACLPVRPDDTLMRDFDALVSRLSPRLHGAVVVMGRNAAAGAQVWSSARVDATTARRAKARLLAALRADEARWFGKRKVLLNERGNRIGESNPMAECSDHDVELALGLRAEGKSLGWIAKKMEVSKSCIAWWCGGGRRGQVPARVKEVDVPAAAKPKVRASEITGGHPDPDEFERRSTGWSWAHVNALKKGG